MTTGFDAQTLSALAYIAATSGSDLDDVLSAAHEVAANIPAGSPATVVEIMRSCSGCAHRPGAVEIADLAAAMRKLAESPK